MKAVVVESPGKIVVRDAAAMAARLVEIIADDGFACAPNAFEQARRGEILKGVIVF